jgi:hypothetical protein
MALKQMDKQLIESQDKVCSLSLELNLVGGTRKKREESSDKRAKSIFS